MDMDKIIDLKMALDKANGKESLAKELFGMLLNELPELRNKLNMAFQANDPKGLWDHTHKIHGSTAYCGVPALKIAAKNMEEAIKTEKSFNEMEPQLESLINEMDNILQVGKELIDQDWT